MDRSRAGPFYETPGMVFCKSECPEEKNRQGAYSRLKEEIVIIIKNIT